MKKKTPLTVCVVIALVAAGPFGPACNKPTKTPEKAEEARPTAPVTKPAATTAPATSTAPAKSKYDFTLTDQGGKKVSLGDYAGKIVVLEWINPDCPYVKRHYAAGTMVKLADKYKPNGVAWLAVNSTYYWDRDKNKAFHAEKNLPYPILADQTGKVGKMFGAKCTPHMFIVDKAGKLAYAGAIDDDPAGRKGEGATNYVAEALDELLAGKAVGTPRTKPYGCSTKYPPKKP